MAIFTMEAGPMGIDPKRGRRPKLQTALFVAKCHWQQRKMPILTTLLSAKFGNREQIILSVV
jgi:hypothetical protein